MNQTDMIYNKKSLVDATRNLITIISRLQTKQANVISTIKRVLAALSECNYFTDFQVGEGYIEDPNMVNLNKTEFEHVVYVFHEFSSVNNLNMEHAYLYTAVQKAYQGFLELLSYSERRVHRVGKEVNRYICEAEYDSSADTQGNLLHAVLEAFHLCNYLNDWDFYIFKAQRMVY